MVDGFGVVVRGRSCCFREVVRRWDGAVVLNMGEKTREFCKQSSKVSCLNLGNFREVSQFQVESECFLSISLDLKSN
jgi:hypothetical protein